VEEEEEEEEVEEEAEAELKSLPRRVKQAELRRRRAKLLVQSSRLLLELASGEEVVPEEARNKEPARN